MRLDDVHCHLFSSGLLEIGGWLSSNGWMKYYPNLALADGFRQALAVVGPNRLVFGTDSSFFRRGWQPVFAAVGTGEADRQKIFADNFDRLFADR